MWTPSTPIGERLPFALTRRRWAAIVLLALVLGVTGTVAWLGQPTERSVSSPSPTQDEVYRVLEDADLGDAVVDHTDERLLVRYDAPSNMTRNESIWYVMGLVSGVGENASTVVIEAYRDGEQRTTVRVPGSALSAYDRGNITYKELRRTVTFERS